MKSQKISQTSDQPSCPLLRNGKSHPFHIAISHRPRPPARHTLWVIVTGLITQHGAFAGGIRAGRVAGVVAPRQQVAFEGGLEGRGGVAAPESVAVLANLSDYLGRPLEVWRSHFRERNHTTRTHGQDGIIFLPMS